MLCMFEVLISGGAYDGGGFPFGSMADAEAWAWSMVGRDGCRRADVREWDGRRWRRVARIDERALLAALAG